jgi:hypothetical protein
MADVHDAMQAKRKFSRTGTEIRNGSAIVQFYDLDLTVKGQDDVGREDVAFQT